MLNLKRLIGRVDVGELHECWEWSGRRDEDGYGIISVDGKNKRVHRLVFHIFVGQLEDDMKVCHSCDNPACCNPTHLFKGTSADNAKDMVTKGRSMFGVKHPKAKLTDADVLQIRQLYEEGISQVEIAKRFGVVKQSVSNIINNLNWKHI